MPWYEVRLEVELLVDKRLILMCVCDSLDIRDDLATSVGDIGIADVVGNSVGQIL